MGSIAQFLFVYVNYCTQYADKNIKWTSFGTESRRICSYAGIGF